MPATGALSAVGALLHVEPSDVVVEELKPSADGKGWIVRLFNASDRTADVRLSWSPRAGVVETSRCNLAEEPLAAFENGFSLAASELIILRAGSRPGP